MELVRHAGDVERVRAEYPRRRGANLRHVLRKRFAWMQRYLGPDTFAVEVGCGAGFSEMFLHAGRLELTDTAPHPWVDRVVDAHALPHADASVDVLINRHRMLPHASPRRGLYLANTTQIYPEDRGTNYSVRLGRVVAEEIARDIPVTLTASPRAAGAPAAT